jgi:hypothetical protein
MTKRISRQFGLRACLATATVLLSTLLPATVRGQAVVNPANGHLYEFVAVPTGQPLLSWSEATAYATTLVRNGLRGRLATLESESELAFINANFSVSGGTACEAAWLGASQVAGSAEPSGNWRWISGQSVATFGWDSGEPNNFVQDNIPEDCMVGRWNGDSTLAWHDMTCNPTTVDDDDHGACLLVEYEAVGAAAIPTLDEYGIVLLLVLMAASAAWALRRS